MPAVLDGAETDVNRTSTTVVLDDGVVALASARNGRMDMEDTSLVCTAAYTEYMLVGVFDGHCGGQVSEALPALFADAFRACADTRPERAWLDAAFARVRAAVSRKRGRRARETPGSTALVALVNRNERRAVVGNLGDCRAVLVRGDGSVERITRDHKVDDVEEAALLRARGGVITPAGTNGSSIARCGGLAISRAFGDADVPAILDVHETHEVALGDDGVLVLASDGLWDAVDDARAATLVVEHRSTTSLVAAAEALRDAGSRRDNVSVVLVRTYAASE